MKAALLIAWYLLVTPVSTVLHIGLNKDNIRKIFLYFQKFELLEDPMS